MRASTKESLASAFVLTLSGAAYAQGAGGAGGGTAGGNGAGQGGNGIETPNGSGITGSTPGVSGSSAMGTTSGNSQKQMDKGEMDSPASGSGIKKPY